jgi:SHAQKYF class myb-like DNA-binding protein
MGRWTEEEHERFLEAMRIYGKDWDKIEEHVVTRDAAHCRSHAQKFFTKLIRYIEASPEEREEIGKI